MSYIGNEPVISATRTVTEISATAGQTTFTANGGYTVGYIDVFVNGSQLQTSDFTATNGSSVTLNAAAIAGDDVRLVAWGTFGIVGNQTIEFADGSASAPSITNAGDNNTGMFFPAADTIAFAEGGVEAMRLDSAGNVGIGTSSPVSIANYKILDVRGTTGAFAYIGNSTNFGRVGWNNDLSGFELNCATSFPLLFLTNGTERMRIDSSGNLLVNTTSTSVTEPGMRYTTNSTGGGLSVVKSGGGWGTALFVGRTSGAGTGTYIEFWYNGTTNGSITTNGSSTSYNTSSDYRLKENIAPMTGALEKVAQLKPCTYTWKVDGSAGQGFIAHELQAVVPDAVTGEKDAVETYTDEEGNEQTRIKPQGIDTSFLVATLTAAIQELNAKVEAQAAEIETLKANQQGSV